MGFSGYLGALVHSADSSGNKCLEEVTEVVPALVTGDSICLFWLEWFTGL